MVGVGVGSIERNSFRGQSLTTPFPSLPHSPATMAACEELKARRRSIAINWMGGRHRMRHTTPHLSSFLFFSYFFGLSSWVQTCLSRRCEEVQTRMPPPPPATTPGSHMRLSKAPLFRMS